MFKEVRLVELYWKNFKIVKKMNIWNIHHQEIVKNSKNYEEVEEWGSNFPSFRMRTYLKSEKQTKIYTISFLKYVSEDEDLSTHSVQLIECLVVCRTRRNIFGQASISLGSLTGKFI